MTMPWGPPPGEFRQLPRRLRRLRNRRVRVVTSRERADLLAPRGRSRPGRARHGCAADPYGALRHPDRDQPRRGRSASGNPAPARRPTGEPAPRITFARSGLTVNWAEQHGSILALAERCDVPTRYSCRSGVCHTGATPVLRARSPTARCRSSNQPPTKPSSVGRGRPANSTSDVAAERKLVSGSHRSSGLHWPAASLPPSGYGAGGGLRQGPGSAADSRLPTSRQKGFRCPHRSMTARFSTARSQTWV